MRAITAMMAQRSIQTAQAPSLAFDNVIRSGMPTQPPFNATVYGMCRQSSVPSPSSPVAVKSVSGTLTGRGRNLFDTQGWYNWLRTYTTVYVKKAVVDNVNCIYYSPQDTFNRPWMENSFKVNTRYTFSYKAKGISGTGASTGFRFAYSDGTTSGYYVQNNNYWQTVSDISLSGKTIVKILMQYGWNQGCYFDENSIQLVEGAYTAETMPAYTPYRGLTYPIPTLNGIEVTDPAIANLTYTDAGVTKYAVTDTWEPCVRVGGVERSRTVRRMGVKVFDGTETIGRNSDNNFYTSPLFASPIYRVICTHFGSGDVWYATNDRVYVYTPQSRIYFFPLTLLATYSAFQSFLAAQYAAGTPVTVYYILATPVTTLGDPMPLETYNPQTNIFTTSAVPHQIRASVLVPRHIA